MDFIQSIIVRQQSTNKTRNRPAKLLPETAWTVMMNNQSDADTATAEKNQFQLCVVSSSIQISSI
jgi:hypothetical protein